MSEVAEAVANIRAGMELTYGDRISMMVNKGDLETVLDRLAELEGQAAEVPDTTSALYVGDEVEVLINWSTIYTGTRGTVESVLMGEEFAIKVSIEGQNTPTGYRRSELRKVRK